MSETDDSRRRDRTMRALQMSATSAVVAVRATEPMTAIGAAILPGALGWMAQAVFDAKKRAAEARTNIWLDNVAAAMNFGSPEDVTATFDEHADEPWARDNLLESYQHLFASLTESVIPIIGRMTADYLSNQAAPDRFFRRFGRLLQDMEPETLAALRRFLDAVVNVYPSNASDVIEATLESDDEGTQQLRLEGGLSALVPMPHHSLYEVFSALKLAGLGEENHAGYMNVVGGPHVVRVRRPDLMRMYRYAMVAGTAQQAVATDTVG